MALRAFTPGIYGGTKMDQGSSALRIRRIRALRAFSSAAPISASLRSRNSFETSLCQSRLPTCSGLIRGVQQLNLFEDTSEMVHLYLALDKLRRRYGSDSVKRASGIQLHDLEERIALTQQQKSISSPENRQQIDNLKNRRFRYWNH